jgi:hypothetical protein
LRDQDHRDVGVPEEAVEDGLYGLLGRLCIGGGALSSMIR